MGERNESRRTGAGSAAAGCSPAASSPRRPWPCCTRRSPTRASTTRSPATAAAPRRRRVAGHGLHSPTPATRPAATPRSRPAARSTTRANGFDPTEILRDFDYGTTRRLASGRVLREWELVAVDKEIEVAPGVKLRGLDLQRPRPGPDAALPRGRAAADPVHQRLRAPAHDPLPRHPPGGHGRDAGDRRGRGGGVIEPGESFTYEFDAEPFGAAPLPLPRHAARVAHRPRALRRVRRSTRRRGRADADELVMVMNGFDTNFDGSNEVYAVNTVGFHYIARADPGQARRARPDLPRQRARVRPDQLVPPPRELLPLLPDRDLAAADRVHRHGDPGPGAARDPRAALPLSGPVHVPRPRDRVRRARLDWASSR